ncbi:MAG: exosortase/archaeosortase family protein [Planctomycetes bacterium]|nr:exosortase/archaeosortase family protein [Planctomycetota bacterium]
MSSNVPPLPKGPSRTVGTPRPVGAPGPRVAAAVAPPVSITDPSQRLPLAILGGLVVLLIAAYWDMLSLTRAAWSEGLYSHGWIVPLFALALLWMRWKPFGPVPAYERWVGVLLVAAGLGWRLFAAEYGVNTFDRWSFLPSIFGIFMMVGGTYVIRWAWPALAFLFFMFPLPNMWERPILGGLQKLASICSTFVLQTIGMAAFRQGNLISIPGNELNIAEACSGLRMGTIFLAMAVFMVFIIERPWWDKFVILLSAIPIALLVNVIRITVIGLLYWLVGPDNHIAQKLGHDWAGLFMMPLALGFLWLELQILERLTIPIDTVQVRPVGGARGVSPVPVR